MADERENLEFVFGEENETESEDPEPWKAPEPDIESEVESVPETAIAPPVDIEDEVITSDAAQEQHPVWAMVILTVWILAFYASFYYFLIGHRFEKFAMGGG